MDLAPNFEAQRDDFQVLADCIEDVLREHPLVRYEALYEYADADEDGVLDRADVAYFSILTNPNHDLDVSVEVAGRTCTIRVNGIAFGERPPLTGEYTHWIDTQCDRVELLLSPTIEFERSSFAGIVTSAHIRAYRSAKTKEDISSRTNGLLGVLLWVIPFGAGMILTSEKTEKYVRWYQQPGDLLVDSEDDAGTDAENAGDGTAATNSPEGSA